MKVFLAFICLIASAAQEDSFLATPLSPEEFKTRIEEGLFDVIVDVRRQDEWDAGHIEGATFMENLNAFGSTNQVSTPDDLAGCELCDIAVYCRSGSRAAGAINILKANGFNGRLYNGQGVSTWVQAGFALVTDTASVVPPCTVNETASEACRLSYLARTRNTLQQGPNLTEPNGDTSGGGFINRGWIAWSVLLAVLLRLQW